MTGGDKRHGDPGIRIASGANDTVVDTDGRRYLDLFSGHGTVLLGHGNPAVVAALQKQAGRIWNSGGLETDRHDPALAAVARFFPGDYRLAALYSTGMEAAEFAVRVARRHTGRLGIVGFAGSMHGKSLATSYLGWDNSDGVTQEQLYRLPGPGQVSEADILAELESLLRDQAVAAVFVEIFQASAGGHAWSDAGLHQLQALCRSHGALLVCDEILTGFHRQISTFRYSAAGLAPDLVLIGKAMGNGFPVAGVVLGRGIEVTGAMLPGSTYAANPLAASVVAATLDELSASHAERRAERHDTVLREAFAPLLERQIPVRGRGALWVIELPDPAAARAASLRAAAQGVLVGFAGPYLRAMPALTMTAENLRRAVDVVSAAVLANGTA